MQIDQVEADGDWKIKMAQNIGFYFMLDVS